MTWTYDSDGNLVNLDHVRAIYRDTVPSELGPAGVEHRVVAVFADGNEQELHYFYRPENDQFWDELRTALGMPDDPAESF